MERLEEIHYTLNIARDNLSPAFITYVCYALTCLDDKLIDKISEEVLFFSSDFAWGQCLHLRQQYTKGRKAIILLSHTLLKKKEGKILHTILHEVAHYYRKHKRDFNTTKSEAEKQEKEANELADKWLKNYKTD